MIALFAGLAAVAVPVVTAAPALAQYATGGTGLYRASIDWFEWGTHGQSIPAGGLTRTNSRSVGGGQTLATTCTLSNVSGELQAYRSGTWVGDALDDLYNVGGSGASNQMVTGISNAVHRSYASFRFACSATLDGVPVPLQGLVVADAEASNTVVPSLGSPAEYMEARPEQAATWRVIDRYRGAGCTTNTRAILSSDGTMRFTPDGLECAGTTGGAGPMAVGFMEGATSARVGLQGGGLSAVALGVVLQADFGDAPASYGAAGALFEPSWQGGTLAVGTTALSGPSFVLGVPGQPKTRLGAIVDADVSYNASPGATGDDTSDQADEDAIPSPGTVHVTPGLPYTLANVRCTGPGYVAGWIDWNRNGRFDAGERSGVQGCTSGTVDLTWTVPADTVNSPGSAARTFLRLRIAADAAAVASPTGMTTSGEVEDYALNVALPDLAIEKTSGATASSRPGDVVTYTVRATNTGSTAFTDAYPAVVLDDLSRALDDATFGDDGAANRPGLLSYASPLLSWSGALAAGDAVELTYTVTLKGGGDGTVRNVAWRPDSPGSAVPPSCDPPVDGADPTTGAPCAETTSLLPKLTVTKSADRTEVPAVGTAVRYRITVTNPGPGAYTPDAPATVTDDLSDVLDAATFDGTASATAGTVSYQEPTLSWSGALGARESVDITYTVTYTGGGDLNLRNLACVPASESASGTPSCAVVQTPGAGLTQWKQVVTSGTPATAGTVLTYTLFFHNDGAVAADVDAVDDLRHVTDDADVTAEPSSLDGLAVARDGNRISITGSVPPGRTSSVTYQVTVKPDGARGDDVAANFLLEPGATAPAGPECQPADDRLADCTSTPIAAVVYSKSVTASDDTVTAGTVLTYTVTVRSTGSAAAPVSREDVLAGVLDDADLSSWPASDTGSVTVGPVSEGRFTIGGVLAPGATATVTYQVTVKADDARGDNRAENFLVPTGGTPPQACEPGDPSCTSTPIALIDASKSSDPGTGAVVVPGQDVTYTLTFANRGAGAGSVDHTDNLGGVLDDATLVAGPSSSDDALVASLNSDATVRVSGVLEGGRTATVTYTVRVRPDGQRSDNRLSNVLAPTGVADPRCEDAGVSCTDHPIPLLATWKDVEADASPVAAGAVLTYTLHFENTGQGTAVVDQVDDLTHVTDDADVTTEPTSADGLTVSRDGNRIVVTGDVPAGQARTVTYQVTVKPDGARGDDIAANFLLAGNAEPPAAPVCQPGDRERPDCTVTAIGRLLTGKSVSADTDPVDVGTVLTYTLTFDNQGRGSVTVDHTDLLADVLDDAELTGDPVASDAALSVSPVVDGAFAVMGELAAGQVVTVTYQVTVKKEADRGNDTAVNFLVPTGETPRAGCVPDDPRCTVTPLAHVSATKSSDPASGTAVLAGQHVTYTLSFTNTGETAGQIDYTDSLADVLDDADLTGAPATSDAALTATSGADGVVRVTGTLDPGQTATVTYTVTVKADANRHDNRLGNVVAKTGVVDPDCADDEVSCTDNPVPLITDSKSVDPASGTPVVAGQELTYALTFTNAGKAAGRVDRVDDLTHLTDDADLVREPIASDGAIRLSRDGNRIAIAGTLQPGQTVTVTYTVKVKAATARGDDVVANFLLDPEEQPPAAPVCRPVEGEAPDCTVNPVGEIAPSKSVDPASGTTVKAGDVLTYTLSFRNVGQGVATVDYTDHLAKVLDDASVLGQIEASEGLSVASAAGNVLQITGAVKPGRTATVRYSVQVHGYDQQGDHRLDNFLTATGQKPPEQCVDASRLCTANPADPPAGPSRLAFTGAGSALAIAVVALIAVVAGGALLTFRGRHTRALASVGRRDGTNSSL
ncbi:MAG TPA: CshA/CshB family fibrillar adhesin-related protein [Cellulomonas sp.]